MGDHPILGKTDILGMCSSPHSCGSKDLVAYLKSGYIFTHLFDFSSKLVTQDFIFLKTKEEAKYQSGWKCETSQHGIPESYSCGVDLYQQLIFFWRWFGYFFKLQTLRRPIFFTDNNFHGIRKGYFSYPSGVNLRALLVYRFSTSLIKITAENAIKPVLYSILVKNGIKNIQKTAL